ncbi:perlucin-like [Haliotis cracherodii]|uniref:perlucin-like n=1 Tax=Haliotis cracherodii TaxID=6455 RepID=UPI0039E99151
MMRTFCWPLLLLLGCALHRGAEGWMCPGGFHKHGRSCYWFSNIKGNFAEARSICHALDSELATITSYAENAFIRGYATQRGKAERYYLGGTDLGLEGHWKWMGNKPFIYTNWAPGEPSNSLNNEHCLEVLRKLGYHWNDEKCDTSGNFICETVPLK